MSPDRSRPLLVLLPGMDGTGRLFCEFAAALGEEGFDSEIVDYDCEDECAYEVLVRRVEELLPPDRDYVLLGESYSGPLAIRLATTGDARLRGLVLCATFGSFPLWAPVRALASAALQLPVPMSPPSALIRGLLTGFDAPKELVEATGAAIRSVNPSAMRARVRNVLAVDEMQALESVRVPVLYLQGVRDRLVGDAARLSVVQAQPSAKVVRFDTSHLILQRQPSNAAAAIAQFVADLGQDHCPRSTAAGAPRAPE